MNATFSCQTFRLFQTMKRHIERNAANRHKTFDAKQTIDAKPFLLVAMLLYGMAGNDIIDARDALSFDRLIALGIDEAQKDGLLEQIAKP